MLISGRGSNLQALIGATQDGRLEAEVVVVISNRPQAAGLDRAREAGIETLALDHKSFSSRDAFDKRIAEELNARKVRLVCLAGFMRLIGAPLLEAFPNAILNIHPSLLPSFPGVDAQRQAFEYGVKITGVSVHLVTKELDAGPVIVQSPIAVRDDDTAETLASRMLVEEHRLYPEAVKIVLAGQWRLEGRRFVRTATMQME